MVRYDYEAHARNCVAQNVSGPGTRCTNPAAHGNAYVIDGLYTYADLSTGHLPQHEMDNIAAAGPRVIEHEFGAWVNVLPIETTDVDEEMQDFPHLRAVLDWARKHEARWINFDRDGELIDGLQKWEW